MAMSKTKKGWMIITGCMILCLFYIIGITQRTGYKTALTKAVEVTPDKDSLDGTLLTLDPWQEINKIAEKYLNNQVQISGNIKLYDYENLKLLEEQSFSYTKSAANMQYTIGSMELASNEEYSVAVDNTLKIIALSKSKAALPGKVFDVEKLKKLLSEHKSTSRVFRKGVLNVITVENIDIEDVVNYKIYYIPGSYKVVRIILEMATAYSLNDAEANDSKNDIPLKEDTPEQDSILINPPLPEKSNYTLEINYTHEITNPERIQDPVKKYILLSKNKVELTAEFKDYELVNPAKN